MAGEYCEFIDTVKCSDYSINRDTVCRSWWHDTGREE